MFIPGLPLIDAADARNIARLLFNSQSRNLGGNPPNKVHSIDSLTNLTVPFQKICFQRVYFPKQR